MIKDKKLSPRTAYKDAWRLRNRVIIETQVEEEFRQQVVKLYRDFKKTKFDRDEFSKTDKRIAQATQKRILKRLKKIIGVKK